MKLIIQIPCFNEEEHLPQALANLPTQIDGIDEIEYLIIDDGSHDETVNVARQHGVHYIVTHRVNQGLAVAFQSGLTACIQLGADIIVNTDADNQYPGDKIPDLIRPIMTNEADMVIADRQTHTIAHFSPIKRYLQQIGSAVVRFTSGEDIPDAPSGFRAFSRSAALRMHIFTQYTYTLETIIQASHHNLRLTSIPVTTNPKTRDSRLMKSTTSYVFRSASTLLLLVLLYQPLRAFAYLSIPFYVAGGLTWIRYGLILLVEDPERGANIQSITVGSALIIIAVLITMLGFMGKMVAFNRRLQEQILYQLKQNGILPHVEIRDTRQQTRTPEYELKK